MPEHWFDVPRRATSAASTGATVFLRLHDHHDEGQDRRDRALDTCNGGIAACAADLKRVQGQEVQIRAVTDHLESAFPAYPPTSVAPPDGKTAAAAPDPEAVSLFDVEELADAALRAALAAPIEGWMTFLHPDQAALVARRFTGPARISGPAGTGLTVVGLHRAVHLAQRSPRRVLYVTYANNLPRISRSLVEHLAPQTADRIEFTSLHILARELLAERNILINLHGDRARSLLSRAWQSTGRDSVLARLEPNPAYWIDEVDHVFTETRPDRHRPLPGCGTPWPSHDAAR